jgi:hypothetical protein
MFRKENLFFNNKFTKNNVKQHSHYYGHYAYKVEFKDQLPRTQKRWFCEVLKKKNNQTLNRVELHEWSIEKLNQHPDFNAINNTEIQSQLRIAFNYINPKMPVNIVVPPKRNKSLGNYIKPKNSIIVDENKNLYFSDDIELVSKAVVQLIYELRCKLFHGEVDPNEANLGVYEQAYNIQKMLIQELR